MADSEKINIQLLSSEKYGTWKIQMRMYLTHKGLDSCIKPEEQLAARSEESKAREAADQKQALALIGLKVKPEFPGVIEDADGHDLQLQLGKSLQKCFRV
jgi:hypothetical protein